MSLQGTFILKGLAITFKHFIRSYTKGFGHQAGNIKENGHTVVRQDHTHQGMITVQYPEEHLPQPERLRVLPVLIYDEADGNVRCTSCGICAKVCPPQCIWIVQAKGPDGKVVTKPQEFFIDTDVCMNCGFCTEFCPFDAIKMDHHFELSNYEREKSHIYNLQDLLVSSEYHGKIHPLAWKAEEAKRAEKTAVKHA